MGHTPWYRLSDRREQLRLFCLPFAGGGAATYRSWQALAPAGLEIVPVELPGRERRIGEPAHRRMDTLVEALIEALHPCLAQPFALFGHSMGALVGFELARALETRGSPTPQRVFASGCRPPSLAPLKAPVHRLPDPELLDELRRYNGTPEAVLSNPELMAIVLPTLRADMELVADYPRLRDPLLSCPVTALGGDSDPDVPPSAIAGWAETTRGGFDHVILPGDHFFIGPRRADILDIIGHRLLTESPVS